MPNPRRRRTTWTASSKTIVWHYPFLLGSVMVNKELVKDMQQIWKLRGPAKYKLKPAIKTRATEIKWME